MKLIQLELKKINTRPYLLTAISIPFISLIFMYFLAFVPKFDSSAAHDIDLNSYSFIYSIGLIINVAGYICLGTSFISKLIIDAYNEPNIYLTLNYPVTRQKIFTAKLLTCAIFISLGVIFSSVLSSLLFFTLETLLSIVNQSLNLNDLLSFIPITFVSAPLVMSIITISLAIGWKKNSVSLTVISGILLFSIVSNLLAGGIQLVTFAVIPFVIIASIILVFLIKKVNSLEV